MTRHRLTELGWLFAYAVAVAAGMVLGLAVAMTLVAYYV